jgi:hypothetical protein
MLKVLKKALNAAVAESILIPVNASGGVAKAENIFKLLSNSYDELKLRWKVCNSCLLEQ